MNKEHRQDVTMGPGSEEWAPCDPAWWDLESGADGGRKGRMRHLWGNCARLG